VDRRTEPVGRYRRARRGEGAKSRRPSPAVLGAIALGGAFGSAARYGVARLIEPGAAGFPWATFSTNVGGSLALGFLLTLILERFPPSRYLRPFAATGFLGAFTTYSTFAIETDLLVRQGHTAVAAAYAGASFVGGFLAVWGGMRLARARPYIRRRARG
jgi:fluoride exporter